MVVNQVWESMDPREGTELKRSQPQKRVLEVSGDVAVMMHLVTARKSRVSCKAFLSRQNTRTGYRLIGIWDNKARSVILV